MAKPNPFLISGSSDLSYFTPRFFLFSHLILEEHILVCLKKESWTCTKFFLGKEDEFEEVGQKKRRHFPRFFRIAATCSLLLPPQFFSLAFIPAGSFPSLAAQICMYE